MNATADRQSTCGAKTRYGQPCARTPVPDRRRSRLHGGLTPRGIASPHFKHDRYSTALPADLAARYQAALTDPRLLELSDEIAVIDARTDELLDLVLPEGDLEHRAADAAVWRQIARNIALRRILEMSEIKRLLLVRGVVRVEEVMTLLQLLADAVQRHVTDPAERSAILRAMDAGLHRQGWDRKGVS
ncbi:MAG: HGGxSTG domain-containing protein [Dehalococcoidia bacterium]